MDHTCCVSVCACCVVQQVFDHAEKSATWRIYVEVLEAGWLWGHALAAVFFLGMLFPCMPGHLSLASPRLLVGVSVAVICELFIVIVSISLCALRVDSECDALPGFNPRSK